MCNLLNLLCKEKEGEPRGFNIDLDDQIVRGMTCVYNGDIIWPPPAKLNATSAAKKQEEEEEIDEDVIEPSIFSKRVFDLTTVGEALLILCAAALFSIIAAFAPVSFIQQLLYFILAGVLGYYLIENVEPALFSPLMSTSNSLSGVVILGGILMVSATPGSVSSFLGCFAIAVAATNVFGGFAVSFRMLQMFKKG